VAVPAPAVAAPPPPKARVLLTQEQVTRLRLDDKNQCIQLSAVGCLGSALLILQLCWCPCSSCNTCHSCAPPRFATSGCCQLSRTTSGWRQVPGASVCSSAAAAAAQTAHMHVA
jgi:hypothetical protein